MAIAVRNIATATAGSISTITLNIPKPTGTVDGDLMYVHIQVSSTGISFSAPANWDLVDSDTANIGSYLYRKTAASEGSTFIFSAGVLGNTSAIGSCISLYDTEGVGNPSQDVYTETVDTSADTTADNTGVTPTFSPGSMLVAFMGGNGAQTSFSSYAVANNNPSWTEDLDTSTNFGGSVCSAAIAHSSRDFITATGAFTATIADALATAVYLVSIKPAGVSIASTVMNIAASVPTPAESSAQTASAGFTGTGVMPAPTVTEADPLWQNTTKSSSSWTNTQKS